MISIILSSRSLMHSSVSLSLLFILSDVFFFFDVFFISAIASFIAEWIFSYIF